MVFDDLFKGVHIHVAGISINTLAHKSTQLKILFVQFFFRYLQNVVAAGPPPTCMFTVRFL